ncbi:NAD-dependent epimerase/dehydratase family protein [Leptospira sp. 96542]|nr:NAD-dependent epimerase/dehydratase family protein [Leptospira sp. 96542]
MMNQKTKVLVTGGTGFLAVQTISQLLRNGYSVNTTLRDLNRKRELWENVQELGVAKDDRLEVFQADLTEDKGWADAVKDCEYILHMASPFPQVQPEDENELIVPARDGVLRVLKEAVLAKVKRVVLTSSFAAVGYSRKPEGYVFNETDWTDPKDENLPYIKSKTIAELTFWEFAKENPGLLEYAVVNPVGIFGPYVGKDISTSIGMIQNVIDGKIKEDPGFTFGVVDVRDVVDLHLEVMLNPKAKGERFIASSESVLSFSDIADLIKKERPNLSSLVHNLKPTHPSSYIKISNEKAKKTFNWNPRSANEAILATVDNIR